MNLQSARWASCCPSLTAQRAALWGGCWEHYCQQPRTKSSGENLLLITRLPSCEYQTGRLTECVAVKWRQIKNVWVWRESWTVFIHPASLIVEINGRPLSDPESIFVFVYATKRILPIVRFSSVKCTRLRRDPDLTLVFLCCYSSCCFPRQKLARPSVCHFCRKFHLNSVKSGVGVWNS